MFSRSERRSLTVELHYSNWSIYSQGCKQDWCGRRRANRKLNSQPQNNTLLTPALIARTSLQKVVIVTYPLKCVSLVSSTVHLVHCRSGCLLSFYKQGNYKSVA